MTQYAHTFISEGKATKLGVIREPFHTYWRSSFYQGDDFLSCARAKTSDGMGGEHGIQITLFGVLRRLLRLATRGLVKVMKQSLCTG
jgi:hypothetical protein